MWLLLLYDLLYFVELKAILWIDISGYICYSTANPYPKSNPVFLTSTSSLRAVSSGINLYHVPATITTITYVQQLILLEILKLQH